jgi:hypothetical protein
MISHTTPVPARGRWAAVAVACLCAAASAGCVRDSRAAVADDPRPAGIPNRKIVFEDWTTAFKVGGTAEDTVLQSALQPVVGADGVSVIDHFAKRVEHFDHTGRLVWTYGQEGRGPDEFINPRDLKVDAAGRLWVMDPGNVRLTVLGKDGKAVLRVPLGKVGSGPMGFIPLTNDEAYVVVANPQAPLVRVAADGQVLERRSFPWPRYNQFHFLATQAITAVEPHTGRWAAAFQVGDGFFTFDGREPRGGRHRFVEAVTFPRITQQQMGSRTISRAERRPTFAAMSVTASPERLYVLFAGTSGNANRIVDSYSLASGAYVESFLLPHEVDAIAWSNGGLYVIENDPFPALAALRPQSRALP